VPTRLPLLIVDDEPPILDLLHETLQDAGYPVLTASNGREALAIAEQTRLALVLTDVMMPYVVILEPSTVELEPDQLVAQLIPLLSSQQVRLLVIDDIAVLLH
jgi:CheY-like chemotaxis protein